MPNQVGIRKVPAVQQPVLGLADLGQFAAALVAAVAATDKSPAVKTDNQTAKLPAVEAATVVLVKASAASTAGALGEQHWWEVAAGQEQLAWDWTVQMKQPVKHLEKHSVESMAVMLEVGQAIAQMAYSGQMKQVPWIVGPEAAQSVEQAPAEAVLAEHSAIVQGNSVVDQVAFAWLGSVGLPGDALVPWEGSCPRKHREPITRIYQFRWKKNHYDYSCTVCDEVGAPV